METIKKLIIAAMLAGTLAPVAHLYAKDADADEEERKEREMPTIYVDSYRFGQLDEKARVNLQRLEEIKASMNRIVEVTTPGERELLLIDFIHEYGIDAVGARHETLLMRAAQAGAQDLVCMLLDQGANVEIGDGDGETALAKAARGGHAKIVEILLDQGVHIDQVGRFGSQRTPLMAVVVAGNGAMVDYLISLGAEVDRASQNKLTPLMYAVTCDNADIINLLARKGANLDKKGNRGDTALIFALRGNHFRAAKALIDQGAIDEANNDRCTPLMYASGKEYNEVNKEKRDIVRMLIERGADVNKVTLTGMTPLLCAAKADNIESMAVLIFAGAEYRERDWAAHSEVMRGADGITEEMRRVALVLRGIKKRLNKQDWLPEEMLTAQEFAVLESQAVDVCNLIGQYVDCSGMCSQRIVHADALDTESIDELVLFLSKEKNVLDMVNNYVGIECVVNDRLVYQALVDEIAKRKADKAKAGVNTVVVPEAPVDRAGSVNMREGAIWAAQGNAVDSVGGASEKDPVNEAAAVDDVTSMRLARAERRLERK